MSVKMGRKLSASSNRVSVDLTEKGVVGRLVTFAVNSEFTREGEDIFHSQRAMESLHKPQLSIGK
jgi:hypothetical protein